jgi:hypothetical protein
MTMTAPRPALDELAGYSQWVCWRWEERNGKKTKPPFNARTGALASSTDPATWATFAEAIATGPRFEGPGFVLTETDPFTGIDLDHCVDEDGRVAAWAQDIVNLLDSYTEITPSTHGLRIFVRATLPGGGRKRGDLEVYDRGRYLTVTARRLAGTRETIEDRQVELDQLLATHFAEHERPATNGHRPEAHVDLADADLLELARQAKHGDRFQALYDRGDWQGAGYPSQSEADLALVSTLLFWTNGDATRTDRLFRAGRLMRPKWTSKHGAKSYGAITIEKALATSSEAYIGSNGHHAVSDAGGQAPGSTIEPPYTFAHAVGEDHFVSQFIQYGAECVDSAYEYLETVSLICLAAATPGVRAQLRQYPRGLPTAFYAILIGDSTRSRKSTAAGLGLDLLADVVPDCQLAEQASPEAFVEQLAARSNASTLWYVDELGETLDKLHHAKYMAGLRGLLLQLYEGRSYRYKRTTKRTKKGEAIEDSLVIENPNLSLLGATTESIFEIVTGRDISSGFMARFAVVMPTSRPPRMGLEEATPKILEQRQRLADWLHRITLWARTGPRAVRFAGQALPIIDRFAEAIETSDALANVRSRAMLQRLNAMTVKLAMLAAVGRPDAPDRDDLVIHPQDADAAVTIATRWRDYASTFGEKVGETALEQLITRALDIMRVKRRAPRRMVAQLVHCSKRVMDDIESTLEDRGHIVVEQVPGNSGPAARFWTVLA